MKPIESIKPGFINPLIRKVYRYLGDYIDQSTFTAQNITFSGLKDIDMDINRINDWLLRDFFFKVEKARIGEVKAGFKVMAKEIRVSITDINLWLSFNGDLFGLPIKDPIKFVESHIKKVLDDINKDKKPGFLFGFNIIVDIKSLIMMFRPCEPSIRSEIVEVHIGSLDVNKPIWNIDGADGKNPDQGSPKKEPFTMDIGYKNLDVNLLSPLSPNTAIDVNDPSNYKRSPVFMMDPEIRINLGFEIEKTFMSINYDLNIQKVSFTFNHDAARLAYLFYLKLMIYPYTSVLIGDVEKNIENAKTDGRIFKVITELVKNIKYRINNIGKKYDKDENAENNAKNTEANKLEAGMNDYSVLFDARINVQKVYFVIYDDSQDPQSSLSFKTELFENNFLDVSPYENLQVVFDNLTIQKRGLEFRSHMKSLLCKYFEINENLKHHASGGHIKKPNAHVLDSKEHQNYKSYVIFNITKRKLKSRTNKSDDIIEFNSSKNITESIIDTKGAKEEFGDLQENYEKLVNKEQEEKNCFLVRYKDNRLEVCFEQINLETTNILDHINNLIGKLNQNVSNYLAQNKLNEPVVQSAGDSFTGVRDSFIDLVSTKNIESFKALIDNTQAPRKLFLNLQFEVFVALDTLNLLGSVKHDLKPLIIRNLTFTNEGVDKLNAKFLTIESIQILSYFVLNDISVVSVKYSPKECINNWECRIGQVTNAKKHDHHSFLEIYKAFYQFVDKVQKSTEIFSRKAAEMSKISLDLLISHEPDSLHATLYTSLNLMLTKYIPKWAFYNIFEFYMKHINVDLVDSSEHSIGVLNVMIQHFIDRSKSLKLTPEAAELMIKPMRKFKVMNLDCSILAGAIYPNGSLHNLTFDFIKFKLFEFMVKKEEDFMIEVSFNSCFYLDELPERLLKMHAINLKLRQSKQRYAVIAEYIFEVFLKQLLFLTLKSSEEIEEKQNKLKIAINKIDLAVYDPTINLMLELDDLRVDALGNTSVTSALLSRITNINDKTKEKMIVFKDIKLTESKDLFFRAINGRVHIQHIKMISDVWDNLKEAAISAFKHADNIYAFSLHVDSTENLPADENLEESLKPEKESLPRFDSWDTFKYFDEIINSKTIERPEDYTKRVIQFMKFCDLGVDQASTLTVGTIKMVFIDDIYGHKFYLDTGIISVISSKLVYTYLIETFQIYIEKSAKKTLIAFNHRKDFAIKLFMTYDELKRLGFYLKIDELDFSGNSKLWDILDNRLKLFLKDFTSADPGSPENMNKEQIMLSQAALAPIIMHINMFSEKIVLEIEAVKSTELSKSDNTLYNFQTVFINKTIVSMKETAKYISLGNSLKLAGFILWRLLVFVLFKRNFMKVNKSIYRYFRGKPIK